MYTLTMTTDSAVIIRDALRLYKERWPGGEASEQVAIMFLETEFTKIVLEGCLDA